MKEEGEYVLGTDGAEIERLRFQHVAWLREAHELLDLGGFRAGDTLLDLGSGPGFTTFELAQRTGPGGRVIARDVSARFLGYLESEARRMGISNVEASLGPAEELDLEPTSIDGAYARWFLCWLPDPGSVLERVARAMKPGATLLLQEYLDWAAMKLIPGSAEFDRTKDACMRSWKEGGGTIDVADLVPTLASPCGLRVVHFRPLANIVAPGTMKWRWLKSFYDIYLPKLVERGLLEEDACHAALEVLHRRTEERRGFVMTPTVADLALRKE